MSAIGRLKAKYLRQLAELIESGAAMPMEAHSKQTTYNMLSGESTYHRYKLASWSDFVEWRTSCAILLDQVVPKSSVLRGTVETFHKLQSEPKKVEFGVAFLRSVKKELESGNLDSFAVQVEAEVLTDYLEQASAFMGGKREEASYVAAAVVAGASLERALRSLCERLSPPEPSTNEKGAPFGLNGLIDALKKREVFNELQAKQLRAWAAIRNDAAHGNQQSFSYQQVELMLDGIGAFLAEHFA